MKFKKKKNHFLFNTYYNNVFVPFYCNLKIYENTRKKKSNSITNNDHLNVN